MELTEAIHRSLEPDEVLKAITRGLITYMEYTTGFFMVWDGEKDRFEVRSLQTGMPSVRVERSSCLLMGFGRNANGRTPSARSFVSMSV